MKSQKRDSNQIKASYHNERRGNASHNDREFLKGMTEEEIQEKAPHIDRSRSKYNKLVCVYKDKTFEEAELEFYKRNFQKFADEKNRRAIKARHKERANITTKKLWESERTRPEETILQIGDMHDYPDNPKILVKVFEELQRYSNEITHKHAKMLDAALHMDESTPHIHIRKVWVYKENGIKKIGQEKALEQAGFKLPHPDEPRSRYNNRKRVYDQMMREKLYELCKEHGLEIDVVPDPHNVTHLTKQEFSQRLLEERREEREKRRRRKKEKKQELGEE